MAITNPYGNSLNDLYNSNYSGLGGIAHDQDMQDKIRAMMNQQGAACAKQAESKPAPKPQDPMLNPDLLLLEQV